MDTTRAVHFVGISGIGMSALARLLLARGVAVSGSSDRRTTLTDQLQSEGARVSIGHDAEHLGDAGVVVVSSAIAADNPEVTTARERGLRVLARGTLLAELMRAGRGVAIAGTHGKTTTTAMVGCILEHAGLDPTIVVGGELISSGTNARAGAGPWFVAESDESDRSFLDLRPEVAVVLNVENDHVDSDEAFEELVGAFESFLGALAPGAVAIVGTDEPRAAQLARRRRAARTVTFGFGDEAVAARNVRYADFGARFDAVVDGVVAGPVSLRVPGAINVQNALAAIAAARAAGLEFEPIAAGLAAFRGVRRRFEIVASTPRMTVVDDYAHHPTAVEATIASARAYWDGPIVAAFEPHRYSRTRYLGPAFALALRGADHVVLTGVYAASEAAVPGVDARTIGAPLEALGVDVAYVDGVAELPQYLFDSAPEGALVLVLGAGTVTGAAHRLSRLLQDGALEAQT
jgi:UDP-N-acetylmuramate--alanine ligase